MSAKHLTAALLVLVLALAGCATGGGGNQIESAIYATHRTVTNLDKNLEPSVGKLNENVAGLLARMDSNDQQVKALQSTVEENTVKLNSVDKKLGSLITAMYKMSGMSVGGSASMLPAPGAPTLGGEITVTQPPAGAAPSAPPAESAPGALAPPSAPAPMEAAPGAKAAAAPAEAPPMSSTPAAAAPAAAGAAPAAAVRSTGDPDADYQSAQRSYAGENYAAALDQFNGFLQHYPNSQNCPNAQFWKAKSLQNLEKYDEAVAEFTKVRKDYPASVRVPYAMLYEALCQKKLGQAPRATELLKQVVKDYPMTPAADQAKTELQRTQGNN